MLMIDFLLQHNYIGMPTVILMPLSKIFILSSSHTSSTRFKI